MFLCGKGNGVVYTQATSRLKCQMQPLQLSVDMYSPSAQIWKGTSTQLAAKRGELPTISCGSNAIIHEVINQKICMTMNSWRKHILNQYLIKKHEHTESNKKIDESANLSATTLWLTLKKFHAYIQRKMKYLPKIAFKISRAFLARNRLMNPILISFSKMTNLWKIVQTFKQ